MQEKESVVQVIFEAVEEINRQLPERERLPKALDAVLFGSAGKLDSLSLVHLIVAIEQRISEAFGVPVTLADERALSQQASPFRSLGTLADYVVLLLGESRG